MLQDEKWSGNCKKWPSKAESDMRNEISFQQACLKRAITVIVRYTGEASQRCCRLQAEYHCHTLS
jgi:hypothetical protein